MRFTRLISSFAAIGALSMLVVAGCSSSDNKVTPSGDEGGGGGGGGVAGKTSTTAKVGGSAGTGTTTTTGKAGASGAATTTTTTVVGGAAGAATTVPVSGGAAGAATTTTVPVSGGAAGAATTTTTTTVGGTTGVAGSGSGGTGGVAPTGKTLDDLIGAICGWEFKCCDAGEAKWELGPTIATAAACKSAFVYLLHSDNTPNSPYPATLPGLLTALGYSIDTSKVTENPTGIAACIAQWNARTCNVAGPTKVTPTHCTAGTYGAMDACDLSNLVKPKQPAGQACNFALNQATTTNDIECVAGTSCVNVNDPDNPSTSTPTCVTRGTAGAVCTSDAKCDYGFYCDTTGTGTCLAKAGPGEACAYRNEAAPVAGALAKQCKPGLECNPSTKTCTEFCKTGYVCNGSDFSCPAGQSCIPITTGSVTTFSTCSAAGSTIARCDSAEDCGTNYYCSGTTCAPVLVAGDTCSGTVGSGECGTSRYCTAAKKCAAYTLVDKACTQATTGITSTECDPVNAIGCVYKWDTTLATPAESHVCSAALLANGERCGNGFDCATGKCEFASSSATYRTCIAGAALGAACLATAGTAAPATNITTCQAGFTCKAGACVAQVGPGGNCELSTTPGQPDPSMCKNSVCDAVKWKDASAIMCTDAIVPVTNGGTGVACDGV